MTLSDDDRTAVLELFRADVPARLGRLEAALAELPDEGARERLSLEAHTLRGAAAMVGLAAVSALAAGLEAAIARGDDREARLHVGLIRAALDPTGTPRTVLCIEDDPINLLLIRQIAASCPGVTFLSTQRGTEGLELAQKHAPDLVLLDLRLADMSGEEVLRRLRADPVTGDIPVVVLSAEAMPARIEQLREAGAADYVTKPYDIDRMSALLSGSDVPGA